MTTGYVLGWEVNNTHSQIPIGRKTSDSSLRIVLALEIRKQMFGIQENAQQFSMDVGILMRAALSNIKSGKCYRFTGILPNQIIIIK